MTEAIFNTWYITEVKQHWVKFYSKLLAFIININLTYDIICKSNN